MTKPLMLSASLSCQRYQANREEVKKKKLQTEKGKKKKLDRDEVDELREKRSGVIEMKDSLERHVSSLYDEMERVSGMKQMKF